MVDTGEGQKGVLHNSRARLQRMYDDMVEKGKEEREKKYAAEWRDLCFLYGMIAIGTVANLVLIAVVISRHIGRTPRPPKTTPDANKTTLNTTTDPVEFYANDTGKKLDAEELPEVATFRKVSVPLSGDD